MITRFSSSFSREPDRRAHQRADDVEPEVVRSAEGVGGDREREERDGRNVHHQSRNGGKASRTGNQM